MGARAGGCLNSRVSEIGVAVKILFKELEGQEDPKCFKVSMHCDLD